MAKLENEFIPIVGSISKKTEQASINLATTSGIDDLDKDAKLIVRNGLKLMFSKQPQTLQLRPADTFGLCLLIPFEILAIRGIAPA